MKIILVRHGETTANVANLFCGHTDVALTEKGIHQAEAAALKLKNVKITKVISSDLKRTLRTASIINAYHNLPIQNDERLREMYFGACEGYTYEEIVAAKPEAFQKERMGSWDFTFPEGENLRDLTARVMEAMTDLRQSLSKEDVALVVVHAGVIRSILAMEVAKNEDAYWRFDIDNCGIVELKYFDEFCMLTKLNG